MSPTAPAPRRPDHLPDHLPDHVDVVIVGSGPAGAAYARVLSEQAPHATIVLFEAGPLISDPPGAHVKNIADPAARAAAQRASEGRRPAAADTPTDTLDGYADGAHRLVRPGTSLLPTGWRQPGEDGMPAAAVSTNVGGMAAHWTGACPRPGDSERIPFLPDLDDLLTEGERLLGVSSTALAGAPLAGEVRRRLADALDAGRAPGRRVQPMPLAVRRETGPDGTGRLVWSGSDVVFGAVTRENPRFTLVPEALVTRVLTTDGPEGRRVTGVRVRDLSAGDGPDGPEHEVSAAHVVVAADALRTPQLLWASGVRPPALGRYLNDQPQVVFAVRLRDVPQSAGEPETLGVDPRTTPGITAQSGVSWVPFTDEHPFHGQVMQLDASPVPLPAGDDPVPGSVVGLGWFCAKDVQAGDRVAFSETEVDENGMPAPRLHYTLTARDHRTLEEARAAVRRAALALGDPLDDEPLTFPNGASLHYQGSVRMGAQDDGTSVCDRDSRVWGVAGLHVAGNGVIPTATACNPTLTSVALAVAGARSIARALQHSPAHAGA
ncbi:GMC oxidoreductase [Kineococcus aurantiacus]|uniref:Choline dehydrogenase-like flavoprotein n=1 Tax=Kineococcus aurantiacus TaxID=37633 RepID=A0A7Y9J2K0_9ACTN|nr:GMC oxidoreductase [Kineococcus aurantiacus]NYD24230.1 choline dehydrogenase-like flavoprotein [Kineococcus aurantiacus]